MREQKGISTLIGIVIIVVVAIVAFGGVFAYQYFVVKTDNTQIAGLPVQGQQATEGWKTYTNDQYGVEFKYPENVKFLSELEKKYYGAGSFFIFDMPGHDGYVCATYRIGLGEPYTSDISEWADQTKTDIETPREYEGWMISGKVKFTKDINVQGRLGKEIIIDTEYSAFPLGENGYFGVFNNKKIYILSYLLSTQFKGDYRNESACSSASDYEDIFNKIISTFKFIK